MEQSKLVIDTPNSCSECEYYLACEFGSEDYEEASSKVHPQCPLQPITTIGNVESVLEHRINCIDGEIQNIQGNLDSLEDSSFDTSKLEGKLKKLREEYNFFTTIKQKLQDKDAIIKMTYDTNYNLTNKVVKLESKRNAIDNRYTDLDLAPINANAEEMKK
jgi:hypothetical protein